LKIRKHTKGFCSPLRDLTFLQLRPLPFFLGDSPWSARSFRLPLFFFFFKFFLGTLFTLALTFFFASHRRRSYCLRKTSSLPSPPLQRTFRAFPFPRLKNPFSLHILRPRFLLCATPYFGHSFSHTDGNPSRPITSSNSSRFFKTFDLSGPPSRAVLLAPSTTAETPRLSLPRLSFPRSIFSLLFPPPFFLRAL